MSNEQGRTRLAGAWRDRKLVAGAMEGPVRRGLRRTAACCCCRTRRSIRPRCIMPRSGSRSRASSPAFPNLRVIFNLGAGVDALMADRSLPDVPLVRVAVADLTERMTEYVVLHVLMHHRQELYLRESQREKRWAPKSQWAASAISVGIMGLGTLGAMPPTCSGASAFASRAGAGARSRSPASTAFTAKQARRVPAADRHPGLPAAADGGHAAHPQSRRVRKTQPQQPARRAGADQCRPRRLAERSRHFACLDDGTLGAASLDVYATEPLPADSPFWTHPKVVLTPHNAADTDPDEISKYVARQIERFEAGGALENVVDRNRRTN